MKNKIIIILVVSAVLIGVLIYFYKKKAEKKERSLPPTRITPPAPPAPPASPGASAIPPTVVTLKSGEKVVAQAVDKSQSFNLPTGPTHSTL